MSSQKILHYNYVVLLIDVTYKTNGYKISLIVIGEITSMNNSYYIAFTFISKEKFEVYKWLLESINDFYKYLDIYLTKISFFRTVLLKLLV